MTYTFSNELIYSLYKDAFGIPPSFAFWEKWSGMTDDEKQFLWDQIVDMMDQTDFEAIQSGSYEDIDRFLLLYK